MRSVLTRPHTMSSLRVRFSDRVEAFGTARPRRQAVRPSLTPGAEVATSLPLQMAVYFNVVYAPLWMVSSVLALQTKYSALPTHYQFVSVLVYVVMMLVETGRLYLAYEGNLREKVPELAGFWLLSLLQTPLTLYTMANQDARALPLERGVCIPLLLFLLVELGLGIRTLYQLVNTQALKFHLMQTHNSVDANPGVTSGGQGDNIEMQELS